MTSIPSNILNSGVRKTISSQKIDTRTVTVKEAASQGNTSTVWVRNDNPDVLVFTDNVGTDWVLNAAAPAAPDLSAVLTTGDDATGLDITNLGSLTFDTAGPQGINIGTDATGATTVLATQIAIGGGSTVGAGNANSTAIGVNAIIDATAGTGSNLVIGTSSAVNGAGTSETVVIGTSSTAASSDSVCIGVSSAISSSNSKSVAIGYDCAISATGGLGQNLVMGYRAVVSGVGISYSVAIGNNVTASSNNGIVLGNDSTNGSGSYNICIGKNVTGSTGDNNTCIGHSITSVGASYNVVSIGNTQSVNSDNCVVIGSNNTTTGARVICIGDHAKASTADCLSVGNHAYNTASGTNNIAIGNYALCDTTSSKSIAIGDHSRSSHAGAIVIGSAMTSTTTDEVTLGTTAKHIRIPFSLDPTAPPAGGTVVLPNAVTMLDVTVNGLAYQIALFTP